MYRYILRDPCKSAIWRTLQEQTRRQYRRNALPPPNVQQAGFGKVFILSTPILIAGGVVGYAKYDAEFRKLVENNVPGAESVFKVIYQEEVPFKGLRDSVNEWSTSVSDSIGSITSSVTDIFGSAEKNEDAPPSRKPKDIVIKVEKKESSKSSTDASQANVVVQKVEEKKKEIPANIPQMQIAPLPSNVVEMEKEVELSASLAVNSYNKAIAVLKSFNNDVRKVVDVAVEQLDTSIWVTLKNRTNARDSAVSTAEKLAREAVEKIELCEIALSKIATADNHEQIIALRRKITNIKSHLNSVKDELYKHKDMANVSEKYWRNVEKARNYFIDEIESIFPGLNLAEHKLNLAKEDLDLLITHAYSHVLAYQKELERLQTEGELRLKRAVEAFKADNNSEAIKAQVDFQLEAEKRKITINNQKKMFQIRADAERQLRQHLKQQAEAHVDHLNDAVALKELELKRNFNRELEDKLTLEKANYKLQLATMLGKMRGMDAALQARAETERSAHQAQALWAACQSLWSTIRTSEPGVSWKENLRPLKHEIKTISKVAEGDELVAVVVQSIPIEAEERGIFPEDALRERFLTVERVARKVALIPENGASIPMYLLSFLQSIFIMKPIDPISQDELEDKEFDYSKLDTYDILNRARYFVDRGNLMQALKYMNLLQGAPRKFSSDWMREARLLLETQQAANTLMAHAAASGLSFI